MLSVVKSGDWIDAARVRRVARIAFIISFLIIAALALSAGDLKTPQGRPSGEDFFSFWSAGTIAAEGAPEAVYDARAHFRTHQQILSEEAPPFYPFFYPPFFLFPAIVFALLPLKYAWLGWMAATMPLYMWAARSSLPVRGACIYALAFPAVFVNLAHGQNGFLVVGLLAGGVLHMEKRPVLAGVLFGLLTFKPQFGLLIPVALMASGSWRTIAAAAVTALLLCTIATLSFGSDIWRDFIQNSLYARSAVLETGGVGWEKMQSLYAALRGFNAPQALALTAQGVLTLSLAVSMVWLWRSAASFHLKGAGLIAASLLATPYLFDYDLVTLAPAMGLLAAEGLKAGFRPYEKSALALAFIAPLISRSVAGATMIPVGFVALAAIFTLIMSRAICTPPALATKAA